MTMLTLCRGIAVPSPHADAVVTGIRSKGLDGREGRWRFVVPDVAKVRAELESLFARPSLMRDDFLGKAPSPGICACGDPAGAEYYAASHNFSSDENNCPLVIVFGVSVDRVYVDPRDFLCPAFQLWDRDSTALREAQAMLLVRLFGPKIARYFESACSARDQTYRIAMCNLAAFDLDVVLAHHANQTVIRGRYRTTFSSAFFVQGPVSAGQIYRVYRVARYASPTPGVTLDDYFGRVGS